MSCAPTTPNLDPTSVFDGGSDYGSDFSPEVEDALNDLLANLDSNAANGNYVVTDIEDYEWPSGLRVPKTLGREQWVLDRKNQQAARVQPLEAAGASYCDATENPEARVSRDRERERERKEEEEAASHNPNIPDTRSPIERFRTPPKKALSVTDLVSPSWCEIQYWYTLTKHGRKRRTPAMKQGSVVHKTMEDEIHTTVPVDIETKEDAWGLRIWNMIQGLRTLRETGITREFEIWGLIDGEIVNGVIDELSHTCPDPALEAPSMSHYENAQKNKEALPEYQTSITDYLISTGGHAITDLFSGHPPTISTLQTKIYVSDLKTRTAPSLPNETSFRPTRLQLLIYHHILSSLTSPKTTIPLSVLADRFQFSIDTPFTDTFIAQIGSLNNIMSSQEMGIGQANAPSSQQSLGASSQDSLTLLTSHVTPSALWTLLLTQLRLTFPHGPESISPVLTASYRLSKRPSSTSKDADSPYQFLGNKTFLFDASTLDNYLKDEMRWWRGERQTIGVDVGEAWKCRGCEFRDECAWIAQKEDEMRQRRKERLKHGVDKSAV